MGKYGDPLASPLAISPLAVEMREAIHRITGRWPVSNRPEVLAATLARLAGARRERETADAKARPVGISLTPAAQAAGGRIAEAEGIGFSALVRKALALYARTTGHKSEASNFEDRS